jgi:hypothetical protein
MDQGNLYHWSIDLGRWCSSTQDQDKESDFVCHLIEGIGGWD